MTATPEIKSQATPQTTLPHSSSSDREIVITRLLSASRELVFKVWTEPKHIAQWWGPKGFTNSIEKMEVRPGGNWRFVMHGPDGVDYPNQITYEEIVPPERLVYSHSTGVEGAPESFKGIVTFEAQEGKTLLTMRLLFASAQERAEMMKFGAVEGGNSTLDCLEEHLAQMAQAANLALAVTRPTEREIVLTRVFNAPRRLVFEAWTKPEHLKRWLGPHDWPLHDCQIDLRPGGQWRYVFQGPDGAQMGMRGVYQEIVPFERIVSTEVFDEYPEHEAVVTTTFEEHNGKTTLSSRIIYPSVEVGDAVIASGMASGVAESYSRLEDLLEVMA